MKRMMWVLPVVMMCGMAMGDSIDDAEAKKRGVPVQQIQMENELAKANAKIDAMQKRLDALTAELAAAKAQTEAAKTAAGTPPILSNRPPIITPSMRLPESHIVLPAPGTGSIPTQSPPATPRRPVSTPASK